MDNTNAEQPTQNDSALQILQEQINKGAITQELADEDNAGRNISNKNEVHNASRKNSKKS